jgi:hypothetical protein
LNTQNKILAVIAVIMLVVVVIVATSNPDKEKGTSGKKTTASGKKSMKSGFVTGQEDETGTEASKGRDSVRQASLPSPTTSVAVESGPGCCPRV